jgi:hypothetical protein
VDRPRITPFSQPALFDRHTFRVVLGATVPGKIMSTNVSVEHPNPRRHSTKGEPVFEEKKRATARLKRNSDRQSDGWVLEQTVGSVITPRESREIVRMLEARRKTQEKGKGDPE